MKDYYGILEVSERASERVIRAAFNELSKEFVNDTARRILLNEAKEVLLEGGRKTYDAERNKKHRKTIGNYRIVSEIAEGGFGKTYKGEHILLGTPVCIKHASSVSPQDEELMKEEARAVWDLRHWAIPAIREIIKLDDGSLAIVQSYVPGPTLGALVVKNGALDPEHVCWITERVLNALKYLHVHGVVHGDVKPDNIIIQPDTHQVVLVDYGLSLVRPRADTVNKGYTPLYASPEQERGMPLLPESDLFSLGITMVYALGGNVPSRQVPDSTPDALCAFIKKLITYNVLNRPNWAKEDLSKTLSDLREDVFGRRYSSMKPLKV